MPSYLTASQRQPISLYVDASDSVRKLFHSELAIPVHPGPLTLVYPRWGIPTYEFPAALLNNIVRLKMNGNGQTLEWKRDLVDKFSFHVVVPDNVKILNVTMDVIAPANRSDLNAATAQLFVLDWYTLVLYPQGAAADGTAIAARLRLPAGWKHACAIAPVRTVDGVIEFPQTSLTVLVDSPVLSGRNFKTVELRLPSAPPVFVDIAAETPEAADLPLEWQDRLRRVIAETGELFGGYPYQQYHFLLALSDDVGNDGLEHRESSDLRMSLHSFSNEANRLAYGYLLPHEYVHSWNGKYRIPAGIVRRNFEEPQTTEMLWVYEGLTRYLNWVLAARSRILSPQEARDYVALLAAQTAHRSGREWRSLQDTAVSTNMMIESADQWQSLRRGADYYDESLFIWLEADTIIRRATQGKRSLDEFCRVFFGSSKNPPDIRPYTFEELVQVMNGVAPYDWKAFFENRLNATGVDRAPLDGLLASGWSLAYRNTPGSVQAARDKIHHTVEERFSLGFLLQEDGTVIDVVRDSAAWNAGLGPDMKVLTVNRRPWSPQVLRDAIAANGTSTAPVNLSVQNGSQRFQGDVDDHRGARYPQLERNTEQDLMGDILKSRSSLPQTP
ncbi:MAG: M61 family peptidase [Acidobacteriia bacterium]|nr:M61 family peptidase [Terriglobia bacterium]